MSQNTNDAISRSDRVLVVAMGIILATASAAIGASLTNHRVPEKATAQPQQVVQVVEAASPVTDAAMAQLLAEHKCLSEVLYYEARGEGAGGQKAIAEVVFHRMNRGDYGHSICAVVYEGKGRPGCQFSFTHRTGSLAQRHRRGAELPCGVRCTGLGRHDGQDNPDRQPRILSRYAYTRIVTPDQKSSPMSRFGAEWVIAPELM